ncbi:MAG: DUF3089 domain-containing protein [Desulfatibacillum sp.]|nr:DUF3089 domain-containing protein [Desulfatibacillum sp.]
MLKDFWCAVTTILSTILLGVLLSSASYAMSPIDSVAAPAAPDFTAPEGWLVKPTSLTAPVDVFFVYPTVLFNDTDWVMDPASPAMRAAAQTSLDTQSVVFEGQANIYAPMYRQVNLAVLSLPAKDAAPLQQLGHDDIWRAFTHYLKYENNGRPFFFAGHSQGSMILANLMLEHWGSTGAEDRLIAALLLGWSLTPADLEAHPAIVMCSTAVSTGCVISYNTMSSGKQSVAPTLVPGALVVNPLSWTMDESFVPAEKNLGAVFFADDGTPTRYPHFTSAQIIDSGLVVQPANVALVTVKDSKFPSGVYHAFDYSLFYENIRANIAERIKAFLE